ncbi:hypothetical protein EVAR_87414_1 [Eumeta japonica]|uniref:Uncharacterized protein n=1 Tax=Eumeta variegata TaxID=151549 RepID=A0A4C1XJ71_EUMVA|nr:hypothetical protein EVAR_87414_1 [Eumeta japonica]
MALEGPSRPPSLNRYTGHVRCLPHKDFELSLVHGQVSHKTGSRVFLSGRYGSYIRREVDPAAPTQWYRGQCRLVDHGFYLEGLFPPVQFHVT